MPPSANTPSDNNVDATHADANQAQARRHFESGWRALEAGDWLSAETAFTQVTLLAPQVEVGHFNLGNALFELKQFRAAAAAYERAFQLEPNPGTLNNLGNAWAAAGEMSQAIDCYRQALAQLEQSIRPATSHEATSPETTQLFESIIGNLGQALEATGEWQAAADIYKQAIQKQLLQTEPITAERSLIAVKRWLRGCCWQPADQPVREALEAARKVQTPDYELCLLAADCHRRLAQYTQELRSILQANSKAADYPQILARLAEHQLFRGRHTEAAICMHRALTLAHPTASLHSHWLATSLYHPMITESKIYEEAVRWATIHALRMPLASQSATPKLDGSTSSSKHIQLVHRMPMQLGVVLTHDIDSFALQCLIAFVQHLDGAGVVVHAYSDQIVEDGSIGQLRHAVTTSHGGRWLQTSHLSDLKLRQLIQSEHIDCLIDVSGHGRYNRLLVFAERAAPLQLAWSTSGATSGLADMDCVLVDDVLLPQSSQTAFTEQACRVESAFCFALSGEATSCVRRITAMSTAPKDSSKSIALGALCPPHTLTPELVTAWCEILAAAPQARLKLADEAFHDIPLREETAARLIQAGLDAHRLELQGISTDSERYDWLETIDLLLDPFPVGQPLSACQALVMGVIVVCRTSPCMRGRMTASVLHSAAQQSCIAATTADYQRLVIEQIHNIESTQDQFERRRLLHQRTVASRLCDVATFNTSVIQAIQSRSTHRVESTR